jgi:hypothetical protein
VRHRSASVDEDADRPADVVAQLRELPGELVGDEAIGRQVAAVEALEGADLARLEALGVAEDADGCGSPAGGIVAEARQLECGWSARSAG